MAFVSSRGGDIVELDLGLPDGLYLVEVAETLPVALGPVVYGAESGLGRVCRARAGVLRFASPPLTGGTTCDVRTTPVAGGAATTWAGEIEVVQADYASSTYVLRTLLPFAGGPSKVANEP